MKISSSFFLLLFLLTQQRELFHIHNKYNKYNQSIRKRMCVSSYKKKRKKIDPCEEVSDNGSNENQKKTYSRRVPWQDRLDALIAFKNKFGHTNVSDKSSKQLANWVYAQRMNFKLFTAGKKSGSLTKERINQLDALNFVWSPKRRAPNKYQKTAAQKLKEVQKLKESVSVNTICCQRSSSNLLFCLKI